ncbi:hypothetical protein [Streptomyces avidinii]|uniref:Uncharacterized protein n=1 Tax=Streptomyces avidinii TaxID=1895 RepID=A0ABS4LGX3_STRAV|nr:hypothetical protein [Streptomyces avidinii]MBP2041268.1 hypothetical protein [Streptomyces avidinii]GGZ04165.1 hypothetical protein GCM10010343_32580 [Streptomyces avidinii]
MSVELPLAAVTVTVLTEGVRFLYDQAGALLARRRERAAEAGAAEESSPTPPVVAEPRELPAPDPILVERFEAELRGLRADLHEYASGVDPVTTTDPELLGRVDALRRVLEAIHGTPLLFTGEPGDPGEPDATTVVRGRVDTDEVAGYVAAVRAERPAGTVEGYVRAKRVEQGGEVVGVDLGSGSRTRP